MLTSIFADIHANRPAFSACLTEARRFGCERTVLLGDYVGYGADPDWAVTTVMNLVEQGAVAVLGNHDNAVSEQSVQMRAAAQVAVEWTRGVLGAGQRQFLSALPLSIADRDTLYVHAEASSPRSWRYVSNVDAAARSLMATSAEITFCGHVHRPAVYSMSATAKMTAFVPTTGVPVRLLRGRRWLVVVGSVGQPRDGDPGASYVTFDTERREVTFCRAPYDIEQAAEKILKCGLPAQLAARLFVGR